MSKKNEPLYMKWWVWVSIFFTTALFVHYVADEIGTIYEEKNQLLQHDIYHAREAIPVMGVASEEDLPKTIKTSSTTFLIGTDLPVGEYFVLAGEGLFGYVLLTRSPLLKPQEIIWQKHFENHTIVNLLEGEFLTAKNVTLIPVDDAIVPNFKNNTLQPGTYRVGKDIPPGIYTLFPFDDKTGYFFTATSSFCLEAHVTARQNFDEPITIALNVGDYFTMMRAEIRK